MCVNLINERVSLSDKKIFLEDLANSSTTQVKKKLDTSNNKDKKKEEVIRDILHKNIGSKTPEPEPCQCVYQHAREIVERKREVLENPPCPCLLNSRRKWDMCPCLTKRK